MLKRKNLVAAMTLVLVAGLSCDRGVAPPTLGGINIVLLSASGTPLSVIARGSSESNLTPITGNTANVLLDGVRVTVIGPTNKTVTVNTATGGNFSVMIDALLPGSYTVRVEGLVGGKVAHFGETSSVNVTAGNSSDAAVSFPAFQPDPAGDPTKTDTVDVLRFPVSFTAIPNATSYVVDWSTSPTMTGSSSKTITGTSTEVTVTAEGKYYYTVRAVNSAVGTEGLPSAPNSVFVFQGVATVTVTPANPTIVYGAAPQTLTAEGKDSDNNVVANVTWFWSSSNQSVVLVTQTGQITAVGAGQASITAIGKGMPGSTTVTVSAPPTKLAFLTQPSNTPADQTIPNVQVAIQNALGQTATSDNVSQVTLAIANNAGGGTLAGTKTVTVTGGVATFGNLNIDLVGSGYTLGATQASLAGATSTAFNIVPGAPSTLAFSVNPTSVMIALPISPAVQVEVRDSKTNVVTSARNEITVAIGTNPSGGVLAGTKVVNAVAGVASFSGLSIDKAGTGYTLAASATSLGGATSAAFDVGGAATKLAFTIQPTSSTAGDQLSPAIQVEIQDANGNRVVNARDEITIGFGTNAGGGSLTGTKKVNAINGIASFSGLWVDKSGIGYTLSANATGLTAATSSAFTIIPGAKARLVYVGQPANVAANTAISPNVTVRFADQFDNLIFTGTDNVTVSLGGSPWKSVLSTGGSVSGTTTVAAVNGLATFNNLRLDKPGVGFTLAATSAGTQTGSSSTFNVTLSLTQLAGGDGHSCAIAASGTGTFCWGDNDQGQLGYLTGFTGGDSIPSLVRGGLVFTSIVAGQQHSCGLTAAGAAHCWGKNDQGQLGNNTTVSSDAPVAVTGAHVFSQLAAGGNHTCGITTASGTPAENQQVYCWGHNYYGQLGNNAAGSDTANKPSPVRVNEPLQTTALATAISAGAYNTCAVATAAGPSRNMYCWGYAGYGTVGDNTFVDKKVPTLVSGALQWSTVSVGYYHACGIRFSPAEAYCWGADWNGQLGDGTFNTSAVPVIVSGGLTWTSVSAGSQHTCGTISGGAARCWGYNGYGQLGDGTTNDGNTPKTVSGGLTFTTLKSGGYHVCGRASTTFIYCWGANWAGQLGNAGNGNNKTTPTQIAQ